MKILKTVTIALIAVFGIISPAKASAPVVTLPMNTILVIQPDQNPPYMFVVQEIKASGWIVVRKGDRLTMSSPPPAALPLPTPDPRTGVIPYAEADFSPDSLILFHTPCNGDIQAVMLQKQGTNIFFAQTLVDQKITIHC